MMHFDQKQRKSFNYFDIDLIYLNQNKNYVVTKQAVLYNFTTDWKKQIYQLKKIIL